jgi:hypothetical protein
MKKLFIGALILFTGCTDAEFSKFSQLGSSQEITCYSGDQIIYHGYSTGKVSAESGGSGHFFEEKGTGKLVEILGNCIIMSAK